jgi:hypothetical protein
LGFGEVTTKAAGLTPEKFPILQMRRENDLSD